MEITTLIASGDSFVAGVELDANSLIPNYTNNKFKSHDPLTKEAEKLNQTYVNAFKALTKAEQNEHIVRCKEKSWPNKLKKYHDVSIINIANGGISNHEIVHRAITQAESCIAAGTNPKNILVSIMLTHGLRFGHPQRDPSHANEWQFQSVYPNDNELRKNTLRSKYIQYLLDIHNDYDWVWQSYTWIIGAVTYLKSLGVNVILLDCCLWRWSRKNLLKEISDLEIKKAENIFSILDKEIKLSMGDHTYETEKLPGGHYTEVVHDWFAIQVSNLLQKNFIIK